MDGKIYVDDLITHHLPLEWIDEGFDLMKTVQAIRSWWNSDLRVDFASFEKIQLKFFHRAYHFRGACSACAFSALELCTETRLAGIAG